VAIHNRRGRQRKQGSADYDGALCDAGHANARNVGGKQRPDRRADRDADAADRREEDSQSTALYDATSMDKQ
jgi:hypothetical protein